MTRRHATPPHRDTEYTGCDLAFMPLDWINAILERDLDYFGVLARQRLLSYIAPLNGLEDLKDTDICTEAFLHK